MATSSNPFGENATKVPMVLDTLTGQIRPLAPGEQISARFVEAPKFLNLGQVPPTIQLQKDYVALYQRLVGLEKKYCKCIEAAPPCPEPEPCPECPPAATPTILWGNWTKDPANGDGTVWGSVNMFMGTALMEGPLVETAAPQSGSVRMDATIDVEGEPFEHWPSLLFAQIAGVTNPGDYRLYIADSTGGYSNVNFDFEWYGQQLPFAALRYNGWALPAEEENRVYLYQISSNTVLGYVSVKLPIADETQTIRSVDWFPYVALP